MHQCPYYRVLCSVGNSVHVHVCIHHSAHKLTRLERQGITLPRVGREVTFHVEISPLVDLEQPQHASKNAKGVESALSTVEVGVVLRASLRMRSSVEVFANQLNGCVAV